MARGFVLLLTSSQLSCARLLQRLSSQRHLAFGGQAVLASMRLISYRILSHSPEMGTRAPTGDRPSRFAVPKQVPTATENQLGINESIDLFDSLRYFFWPLILIEKRRSCRYAKASGVGGSPPGGEHIRHSGSLMIN